MRRLHPISDHEQPVAQGQYDYLADGENTGIGEQWELTHLPDGSRLYRVEVGEGDGLWHLIVAPDGRPDRLQIRLRDDAGRRFDATHTFFEDEVVVSQGQVGKQTEQRAVSLQPGYGLLWAPFAGRELALTGYEADASGPQSAALYLIRRLSSDEGWLSGRSIRGAVGGSDNAILTMPAGSFEAREVVFSTSELPDQRGWLDEHGNVLRWEADSEVRAVLSRYRRFDSAG